MSSRGSISLTRLVITLLIMAVIAWPVKPEPPSPKIDGPKTSLRTVNSYGNLKSLIREMQSRSSAGLDFLATGEFRSVGAEKAILSGAPAAKSSAVQDRAPTPDFSTTNVQVQGVDEADIVKTDGEYIYRVDSSRLIVAKAQPADNLSVVTKVNFGASGFSPIEMYVDGQFLTLIGQANRQISMGQPGSGPEIRGRSLIAPEAPAEYQNTVKVMVFDLADKRSLKKVREAEIEGNYVSSRKVGSALYIVANKYLDIYSILNESTDTGRALPFYRDSGFSKKIRHLDYRQIQYLPEGAEPSYLMVAGLNLAQPNQELTVKAYLGAGQNIYASTENLYIAAVKPTADPAGQTTAVYRFALDGGRAEHKASGAVPGNILNQFSMDEHSGHFRIATTQQNFSPTDNVNQTNNLFVLNQDLSITGKIENIAPGERIYSVRFIGERAYMVTFKNVDPLFVIDLKDPAAPKILGELKIPGYSDYLHPYDENHIIGFGKDTIETDAMPGSPNSSVAYYQGLKIAVFDVSDVARPVEKFKTVIGARGTDSELLQNHKALLFSKEKKIMAFPVTLMEKTEKPIDQDSPGLGSRLEQRDNVTAYGSFAFQGIYVFNIDLTKGMELRGRITHRDQSSQNREWYDDNQRADRALYIGDTLYTTSNAFLKANDLGSLEEKDVLDIR